MGKWLVHKKLARLEDSPLYWEREVYAPKLRKLQNSPPNNDSLVQELLKELNYDIPKGWVRGMK